MFKTWPTDVFSQKDTSGTAHAISVMNSYGQMQGYVVYCVCSGSFAAYAKTMAEMSHTNGEDIGLLFFFLR